MDTYFRRFIPLVFILLLAWPSPSFSQQEAQQTGPESMSADQFTGLLKQVWTFLKNETENYLTSIQAKDEFETAVEFERRATDARRQYLTKVIKYSRDQKLDQRVFSVLFKANLGTYDADKQMYSISSATVVDAPYNIPTVECVIRKNPYISLADSIRAGYRTSSLYIDLPKGTKWQVARDMAKAAKTEEHNIYFRVNFRVDIEKSDFKDKAVLEMVPTEIAFVNSSSSQVYWTVPIR